MKAICNTSVIPKKLTLKDQGNIKIEALNEIIVTKKGKPDLLAIDIYIEVRSWYKPKKTKVNGNVVYSSKLKGHGFQIGYEYFVKKYKCSDDVIRKKLVLLEKLGLLTREFRTEYFKGKRFNNLMYLLVWKDTPYFYSEIGLEKPQKSSLGYPEKQGLLSANSRTPILENKDNIYVIPNNQPKEEKNSSYAKSFLSSESSIITTETNTPARDPIQKNQQNKHATFAPCSLTEPEQVALVSENQNNPNQSVTNCDGLQPPKETLEMKQDDITQSTDEQTRKMLLSHALWKALGQERSGEVQDSWIFQELAPDKVGIYMGSIRFSDIEKEKVPEAIKSVYGQNVKIIGIKYGSKNKEQEHPSNEEVKAPIYSISKNKKATWLEFKAAIRITNLINMLTNPVLKVIETPGKVIIETVPFLIERLTAPGHFDELERVVFQTGLTLELHSTNPHPEYKNFHKDPIVISPGKILEDQEFRQTYEPLVLSEILEEAKRNKEEK